MALTRHVSDRDLVLILDDELPRSRRTRVAAHLERCAPCRARLERADRSFSEFARAYRDTPAVPSSLARRDLRLRLQTRMIDIDRSVQQADGARWWRIEWAGPAIAYLGAALVVGGLAAQIVQHYESARALPTSVQEVEPGALPVAHLTPGATRPVTLAEVCGGQDRPQETIADSVRRAVLVDYHMADVPSHEYELDYLITPELGGSADRQNLWPERYTSRVWNARVKDELEEMLPRLVCDGRVGLAAAQRDIATDWIAAYKKYFRTERPLGARQVSSLVRRRAESEVARQTQHDVLFSLNLAGTSSWSKDGQP